MNTVAYLRVSTEEQRERQSVLSQRDFATKYAALNGITIAEFYCDEGVSGGDDFEHRPEGSRLLRDVAEGKVGTIVVFKLDRIGRSPRLIYNIVHKLDQHNVVVRSMTEPFDLASSAGRFMLSQLAGAAEYERNVLTERTTSGMRRLAEQGRWLGGVVPYGYVLSPDRKLTVDEDAMPNIGMSTADVVRMIYALAAEDKLSTAAIAERLNARNIPTAYAREGERGKRRKQTRGIWRPGRVRNLLVNTTYRGVHTFGQRTDQAKTSFRVGHVERAVPAIVDVATWDKAQQALKDNFRFGPRNRRRQYLLRGLMRCGTCGLTYVGSASLVKNGEKRYYTCNGRNMPAAIWGDVDKRCTGKSLDAKVIEEAVWSELETFLRRPGAVLREVAKQVKVDARQRNKIAKEVKAVAAAVAALTEDRTRILTLYRKGHITEADLADQLSRVTQEREALTAESARLTAKLNVADAHAASLESAGALLAQLRDRVKAGLTWESKREVVEALVSAISVVTKEARWPDVHVSYAFTPPTAASVFDASTGTGSSQR
jgi:site-specific DNA recombinase